MSRKNFCQEVQCPFWDAKNLGCDRFTTAYQCPIRKELPPDVYDSERKFTDSYATQYALYWDEKCPSFDDLERKLVDFLTGDRHYQQLVYLSERDETFKVRRRIDKGWFLRKARVKPSYRCRSSLMVGWSLCYFEDSLPVFHFPVADFIMFEKWLEFWEEDDALVLKELFPKLDWEDRSEEIRGWKMPYSLGDREVIRWVKTAKWVADESRDEKLDSRFVVDFFDRRGVFASSEEAITWLREMSQSFDGEQGGCGDE